MKRASPVLLSAVGVYVLLAYILGLVGLANWPANERNANDQELAVTAGVTHELGHRLSARECFTYLPGPGWPAAIEYSLLDSNGQAPINTPIDVDPSATTIDAYLATAQQCRAVMVYREPVSEVAKVFFVPEVRQPYLQALADWMHATPHSGYVLERSWHLSDLPPIEPHALGRYQGVSLTVEMYLRT